MELLNIILMLGTVLAASAISLICAVGLIVWLAGGKTDRREDEKSA